MKNDNKNEYMKQRKRVQNLIYALNRKGHKLSPNDIVGLLELAPSKKDINKLDRIRTQQNILDQYNQKEEAEKQIDELSDTDVDDDFMPDEDTIGLENFKEHYIGVPKSVQNVIEEFIDTIIETYDAAHFLDTVEYAWNEEGLEQPIPYGSDTEKLLQDLALYFLKLTHLLATGDDEKDMEFQAKIMDLLDTHMGGWDTWEF